MFLGGSLDFVLVFLLDRPKLETPSWSQKTAVTYLQQQHAPAEPCSSR